MQKTHPTPELAFIDSTPLLHDGEALRERGATDGYLFFKQLLPKPEVLAVRRDLLAVVEAHGWRASGQDAGGGELNLAALNRVPTEEMRLDIGVSSQAYDDVQKLESVHRLPHHPRLMELYRTLFDSEVLVHPRHIIRMITSHPAMVPTPQHQDFPLIQGTARTWTCWFPLGDCGRELGGLAVLKASHQLGYLPIQTGTGAGGLIAQTCPHEEKAWVSGEYEAGDVLTFPSFTVHRALRCQLKNQIRLSMDIRFQPAEDCVEERSLRPHCELSWEDIYPHWKKDDLKYYWRRSPQKLSPWDASLHQPQRRIC
jgi:hypothetical protein